MHAKNEAHEICAMIHASLHSNYFDLFCTSLLGTLAIHPAEFMCHVHPFQSLVGGLEHFLFHSVGNVIIPTVTPSFFRGVGQPPSRSCVDVPHQVS
jgi:hypothetical protein